MGEIIDALRAPIPPADLDGLRRRTRVLMGRCQGFYCGARVAALLGAPEATR
jgi:glycerol-3-phosphate dehydrogenase